MNLYNITGEYLAILSMAEDPETDPETLSDTLESIQADFHDKADGYAYILTAMSDNIIAIDREMERLAYLKKNLEKRRDVVRDSLLESMKLTGETKFKTNYHSFAVKKNPASLVLNPGATVPDEYMKIPDPPAPKPDTAKIKAALKSGAQLDFAALVQGDRLEIK